jgi:4-hydroxybenzoate polyprenyltransferase
MTALQAAIGAANDIADAPADAIGKPAKPIPAGLVAPAVALLVCASGLAIGLLVAMGLGLPTLGVAAAVVGVGFAYDFALKGTAWSWLPFALGIPLLPVYAWVPATGSLPAVFVLLLPTAVVAGAALAIANALVDVDRDRLAGLTSVALRLRPQRAASLVVGLHALVLAVAWVSAIALGGGGPGLIVAALGSAGLVAGMGLGRSTDPARRERGWEIQAIAVGLLALGWLAAIVQGPVL